mgnify:CR=1 FL=1
MEDYKYIHHYIYVVFSNLCIQKYYAIQSGFIILIFDFPHSNSILLNSLMSGSTTFINAKGKGLSIMTFPTSLFLYLITSFSLISPDTLLIGKILKIENRLAFLISSGAAICGGTAMAAIAPIIKAKPQELLIALTIVFLLNAIAIILFPIAGNYLEMSDFEFGAWSALAIHDTSSVIGAASIYSNESAQVAATLKLGRTIWLIPLILLTNWVFNKNLQAAQFPRFIIFFILAILVNTFFNFDEITLNVLQIISQSFLMFGLFCIGSQFDSDQLTSISSKPLILALLLWMAVLPSAYFLVKYF